MESITPDTQASVSTDVSGRQTFATFYDFYDGPEHRQGQLAMYRALAAEAGRRVLELACGTGIVAIDLARAGSEVTGLDVSAEMLQVAGEKIAREDADVQSRVRLLQADMKDFKLGQEFDAIFLAGNSFGYLTALDEQRSCLRTIYRHLRPGGLAVIEERNYTPEVLMGMWQRRLTPSTQMAKVNPATGKHTTFNWTWTHVDFVTQTIHSRSFIDEAQSDRTVKRYIRGDGTARNHYFGRFELQLLIEQAGLVVRDLWGGHNRQSLGPRTYNMIFVAKKGLDPHGV